jgi:hypothetical protein
MDVPFIRKADILAGSVPLASPVTGWRVNKGSVDFSLRIARIENLIQPAYASTFAKATADRKSKNG